MRSRGDKLRLWSALKAWEHPDADAGSSTGDMVGRQLVSFFAVLRRGASRSAHSLLAPVPGAFSNVHFSCGKGPQTFSRFLKPTHLLSGPR